MGPSKLALGGLSAAIVLAGIALAAVTSVAAGSLVPAIGPELAAALDQATPGERIPVHILLAGQPSPEEMLLAGQGKAGAERRRAVRALLEDRARQAEAPILRFIHQRQGEAPESAEIRTLWVANVVGANLSRETVLALAARPEVLEIGLDRPRSIFKGFPAAAACSPASAPAVTGGKEPPVAWGVAAIKAPEVWRDYGVTGKGVVVGMVDLGTCYRHPDIANHVWVNPGEDLDHDGVVMDPDDMNGIDDDGNGYPDDLIGWDFADWDNDPDDPDGHGSHVAGTIAGDGASGIKTGVAPGAKLMIVRIDPYRITDMQTWQAMEYAAANGADVTNSSWGYYHSENPPRATVRQVYDGLVALGTIPVCAAGNGGGGAAVPHQIGTPPDVPGSIAVAAVDTDDTVPSFSSQGPTTWEDVPVYGDYPFPPGLAKPEVAAPGVGIDSLAFCSGYTKKSGTSMAAPHVTGAVALLLEKKRMSRDEVAALLQSTVVDLGTPGWDGATGSGRIDVRAAIAAIDGRVELDHFTIEDTDPERGNGDGGVDPGERLSLVVTLRNTRETRAAQGVSAVLTALTPGVAVHDDVAYFPDLPAGGQGVSAAPHFTFSATGDCGHFLHFRLRIRFDGGAETESDLVVRNGTEQQTTIFADDFETDKGWTVQSNTPTGHFVRDDPHEARTGGKIAQPEDDHSPGGTRCWVTGNKTPISDANQDDVDPPSSSADGWTRVTSPRIDVTGYASVDMSFWYWPYGDGTDYRDSDSVIMEMSNDDGATWSYCIAVYGSHGGWRRQTCSLTTFGPTPRMRLRFSATDGKFANTTVDALLDDVEITGKRTVCETFTPPLRRPPNPVGPTLRIERDGRDLRLTWTAPVVDAAHDPATLFRVRRAVTPNGVFSECGSATIPRRTEAEEAGRPERWFYSVWAENSGGPEVP